MDDIAIKVDHVSKTFKLPHERHTSLKSLIINFFRTKRTYERHQVLKDVTFEIKSGDFFAIVGRNGSGKSTLLKLLAGIYSPDQGHIQVNGKLIPFIELGVGFNHELTGRENVFLNGALLGFSRKEMEAMYDEIVEFAELEKFMDQKLKNYSSGMQVRLAFSIAIRAKGDILLLDEVLAVGDAAFQQKCFNYFEELKQQKKTVIFVSHDMGAVRRFCNKAIYLKDGVITHQGTPSDIADIYTVENLEEASTSQGEEAQLPTTHKITAKISVQTDDHLTLRATYKSQDNDEMYVGIAIIKDGISIAEITTPQNMKLAGSGDVTYQLDKNILNAGVYYIGVGLFKFKNRELVAVEPHKLKFIIKGADITKGAALKLIDTWKS
jgi:ABC-2 type transport system ATP-binding protein